MTDGRQKKMELTKKKLPMNQSKNPLIPTGVWTAMVTPFDETGSIDWQALDVCLERQVTAGVTGVVVIGSTGESASLSMQERLSVIRRAHAVLQGRIRLMAGTGLSHTGQTVELSKLAIEAGAESVLVVTPPYVKPNTQGLIRHYEALGREITAPICVYHVPSRTGRRLTVEEFGLLSQLPHIAMIKEASGDVVLFSRVASLCSQPVLSGDDLTFLASRAVGGQGGISVVSNLFPEAFVEMDQAFSRGDVARALALHRALSPLVQLLECDTNPTPIKAALAAKGLCRNEVRTPLAPVAPELAQRIAKAVQEFSLEGIA